MLVYVVMGNDFPDAVFDTAKAAEDYCDSKRAARRTNNGTSNDLVTTASIGAYMRLN